MFERSASTLSARPGHCDLVYADDGGESVLGDALVRDIRPDVAVAFRADSTHVGLERLARLNADAQPVGPRDGSDSMWAVDEANRSLGERATSRVAVRFDKVRAVASRMKVGARLETIRSTCCPNRREIMGTRRRRGCW